MTPDLEQKLKTYRLSEDEYLKIKSLLGREPSPIEWPLYSALWSEHCSYKSSKIHLKKFSYRNERTPLLDGENAGVVDLGFGEKIAFKMESHNHPSFIEPVQGSATGVGGILRDIFTMGARPIMSANYLCFGDVTALRMKELMKGVVTGISSYGNCVGVPTVTGQTNFNSKYNKNILVNALNVGYFGPDMKMALSNASGPGNYVVYVGAKTGRDGVHGASMASASFDEDTESKKPNVQIGDPFYEKLLIEACLEVLEKNLVVAMQDMGAAGLTSSSFEMASKGQVGLVIDLKKVPLRDPTMLPEDILLSESQERMLLICEPKNFQQLHETFKKWHLDSVVLGEVQKQKKVKLMWGPEVLTDIDPDLIVENAPQYKRPFTPWVPKNKVELLNIPEINGRDFLNKALEDSKLNRFSWIYNQYDQRVGARTASACESSVSFCRLEHSGRGLALAVGCRPDVMEMDAQIGAYDAFYYPAFQMALKGAEVLAATDCLNFGNPQKLEIMSQFVASVDAIVDASEKLKAPVISGNVSFYNETMGENIVSTPAIGLVGLRDNVDDLIPDHFVNIFESIIEVKLPWVESFVWLDSLEKTTFRYKLNLAADVPKFIELCRGLQTALDKRSIKVSSIKAVSLGGLATSCLKMTNKDIGFDLSKDFKPATESLLFKDNFYSFLICGNQYDILIPFLKSYFKLPTIEINKIGETVPNILKFTDSFELDFAAFQKQFKQEI